MRGLVHTSTGSDLSDKDVQFIMERLTLNLSPSDMSSNSVAAANYLSPQSTKISSIEPKLTIVQLQKQQQEPKAMATVPVTDSLEPKSTAPEGTVDSPVA